jgi:hypothetical protein
MRPLLLGSFVCGMLVTGAGAQNVTVVYGPTQPVVVQPPPQVVIMPSRPVEEYVPTAQFTVPTAQATYLIAFKNSVVRLADQYWARGRTLYYVTTDRQQMTAPLDSVDLGLSQRLNSERNVVFSLVTEPERTIARVSTIRKTPVSAHRQCRCQCGSSPASGRASRASSPGK